MNPLDIDAVKKIGDNRITHLEYINKEIKKLECALTNGAFSDFSYNYEIGHFSLRWVSHKKRIYLQFWDEKIIKESKPLGEFNIETRMKYYPHLNEFLRLIIEDQTLSKTE